MFAPKLEVKPHLVTFRTPAEGWVQECAGGFHYADARHITVHSEGDRLTVHCLDTQFMEGIDDTPFSQALLKMQEAKEGKA